MLHLLGFLSPAGSKTQLPYLYCSGPLGLRVTVLQNGTGGRYEVVRNLRETDYTVKYRRQ